MMNWPGDVSEFVYASPTIDVSSQKLGELVMQESKDKSGVS